MNQALTILSYINLASLLIPIGIGGQRWAKFVVSLRFAWAGLFSYFLLFLFSVLVAFRIVPLPALTILYVNYLNPALFGLAFAGCYAVAVPRGPSRWAILVLGGVGLFGIAAELLPSLATPAESRWSVPLQTVINTLIPLLFLHQLTRTATKGSLLDVPLFWISLGRLVSSMLSTLYDSLKVPLAESSDRLLMQWLCFQFIVTILCNLVYGYGFWKVR
jgi:hypothetical protein